ncbi:MAG: hypothetical protein F9K19_21100 [Rhizobiaceae bacterium]|nr:MAG: hypothetical protein F9K19_21100 [Rhizobiaceae bacterium]CAG0993779.1 hypothetical protein RHIZO_02396 [Rhizobiaceae bacterium]
MTIAITPFLRNALRLDAGVSGAAALLFVGGASPLAPFTGLPAGLLFWSGVALMPFVAALVVVARRAAVLRLVLVDIVALNALWVAASFGLLAFGLVQPTAPGIAFVVAQALAVAVFAVLQAIGMRRAPVAARG